MEQGKYSYNMQHRIKVVNVCKSNTIVHKYIIHLMVNFDSNKIMIGVKDMKLTLDYKLKTMKLLHIQCLGVGEERIQITHI